MNSSQMRRSALVFCFLLCGMAPSIQHARALSSLATKNAQSFERFQLAKLKQAGLLGMKRPFTIVAEAIGTSTEKNMRKDDGADGCIATKIVHFQRHGQGYHNLIGEMYRDMLGRSINLDDTDPATNPFIRHEMVDSPLTEKGRLECAARRSEASLLSPQVMIVSPLHRAIQTALLSFADHIERVPWIAHEQVREQMGLLMCNKRRSIAETKLEFPQVDFSHMMTMNNPHDDSSDTGADILWEPHQRESPRDETERVYTFLTEFLLHRPERELAVVGHSAWLFTMCNAVLDCGDNDMLRSLFQTSEIRSMRLSFYKE